MHDRLLDLLAIGADFLGKGDRIATLPPGKVLQALLDMAEQLLSLDLGLEALYRDMVSDSQDLLYWSTLSSIDVSESSEVDNPGQREFCGPIQFKDHETSRLLTLYWAQQCLLRLGRVEIHNALAGMAATGMVGGKAERVNEVLSRPPGRFIDSARLVLRSYEYCNQSQTTLLRYSVPLNISLDVMSNKPETCEEELLFARRVKQQISTRFLRITGYTKTLPHPADRG